jgi:hypothetical protein
MESGFQHEIPLRANFRVLNLLNITPGVSYSGVMYTSSIRKRWVDDYVDPETNEVVPGLLLIQFPDLFMHIP